MDLGDVGWGEDLALHELRVDDLGLLEVVEVALSDLPLLVLELFEVERDVVQERVHVDLFLHTRPLQDLEVLAEQLDAERDHELGADGTPVSPGATGNAWPVGRPPGIAR